MSKKNGKSNKATAKPTVALNEIETKIAALNAEKQELAAKAQAQLIAERKKLDEALSILPQTLGLPDIKAVCRVVTVYSKHGTANPKTTRARLTTEVKDGIDSALQASSPATLAEIASQFSVSAPTVFGRKKILGLVSARKATATAGKQY
jgi:hypothetical protein